MTKSQSLTRFFVITFVFSWLFWLPLVLASLGVIELPIPNSVWVIVGAHGPLFASVFLTQKESGWKAVGQLIRSGFNIRMAWKWWLVILLIPVVLNGLAVWLNVRLNGYQPDLSLLSQPVVILLTFLVMFFLGGSFQEEFGWRGYALPRLLEGQNPLNSSLFLGFIWGVWHLPLFHIIGTGQSFMPFGVFLLLAMAFSVLFTWFYLKTDRNLFSALLFHTAINATLSVIPSIELKPDGNQMAFTYMMISYICLSIAIILIDPPFWRTKPTK